MNVCHTDECQACGEAGGAPAGGNRNRSPVRISSWLEPADELTWLGAGLSSALGVSSARCGVHGTERDETSTRISGRGESSDAEAGGGGADSGGSSGSSWSPPTGAPSSSFRLLQLNALPEP